jgi:hypothetical protein
MEPRIMYIEKKSGHLTSPARIGRVTFSRTGRSLYYNGQHFQHLSGRGSKANYSDVETNEHCWISGRKKGGSDRLYGERLPLEIDEDVREEYWVGIRNELANKRTSVIHP